METGRFTGGLETFDSAGVAIRYVEQGEGEPVVLIHGFARSIELGWKQPGILDELAKQFRVIALDCRGHGGSDKPRDQTMYGLAMVEDVVQLLDHLDIDTAHIVGYSMGGRIALKLATTHPARVRTAVLIGSGGARATDDHALWDEVAASLESGRGIVPLLRVIWPADMPQDEEQLAAFNDMAMAGNDADALAAVARNYRAWATSDEEIQAIHAPVVAIIGTADPFLRDVQSLAERLPGLCVRRIDGADHLSTLADPELAPSLAAMLASRAARGIKVGD